MITNAVLCTILVLCAADDLSQKVRRALWGTPSERLAARKALFQRRLTDKQVREVERVIRAGRSHPKPAELKSVLSVEIGDGRTLKVHIVLPVKYDPAKTYPLMVAMGGGPLPNERLANRQARAMLRVWSKAAAEANWIVAAVEDTVSVARSRRPLRYHVLADRHFRRILDAIFAHCAVDPNRVHATGISLGSNYSIAYAAAHPDWFAGIVPVSTEGESREHLIRNLQTVSVAMLEGAKDRNIRSIEGPRRLAAIMKQFKYRVQYQEFPKRGHEGFSEKYPAVLKWLAAMPRRPFPKDVVRLPHPGILLPGRRFYWIEADTHQAAFRAKARGNTIDVQASRARKLTFFLSDRLVDLDKPVTIRVNGRQVLQRRIARSARVAIEDAARLNDTQRFATARVTVDVPNLDAGETWLASLKPKETPGKLAYWEMFAVQTLKSERRSLTAKLEIKKQLEGRGLRSCHRSAR